MRLPLTLLNFAIPALLSIPALNTQASAADEHAEVITITRPAEGGTALSPYLLGAQYTFFAPPIKASLGSAAVMKTWSDLPVKMMRYPGGTWADHYIWDQPANSYFVAGATAESVVSVDQFLDNARALGAEPIIQVNTNSKGGQPNNLNPTKLEDYRTAAKWAAKWVRKLNIEQKRGVRYWEIGNEVWIWYQPEEYARLVVEYSKAMKLVDPGIKIIACGLSDTAGPFSATWLDFSKTDPTWVPRTVTNNAHDWTKALLTIAKDHIDYIAPHPYLSAAKDKTDARGKYLDTTAQISDSADLMGQLGYIRKSGSKVRLAVSEWVTNFNYSVPGSNSWSKDLYFYSHGNGINAAHYFGRILEGADVTDIAVIHSLDDIQTLWYWPRNKLASGVPILHPVYKAMQVWGANLGDRTLTKEVANPKRLAISGRDYPASFSFASEDSRHVYLVVINLDPDQARTAKVRLADTIKVGETGRAMVFSAPSLAADNFDSWEGEAAPASDIHTTDITSGADKAWDLTIPPAGMIGLRLSK